MKLSLSEGASFIFSVITFSSIIYYRQRCYDKLSARNEWKAFYDYVIVGAGSAGATVASRLSEDPHLSVLLLEAGGSETVVSNTPALADTLSNTIMDWKFVSISQTQTCFAFKEQKCHLTSGRVIGGTSAINRMIYLRGNALDYDNWERLGIKGWSWKDVFPAFLKSENQTNSELAKSGYYGVNGPISITFDYEPNPLINAWTFSSELSGYRSTDLNGGTQLGTSVLPTNTKDGKRISSATAYLDPYIMRENLHVLANSFVTKILFNDNKKAIGVNFIRNWQKFTVNAREEVIISAGTINSAKLLMLSGIGPKHDLERLSIPVISDLPVGNNFHDHVSTLGLHFTVNSSVDELITIQNLHQYFNSGKGSLSQSLFGATTLQSTQVNSEFDWPDSMLMMTTSSPSREINYEVSEQKYGFKKDYCKNFYSPYSGVPQFTVLPIILRPKSRGWIKLKTSNPLDSPLINPNYFSNHSDITHIIDSIREAYRIVSSKPFQQLSAKPFSTLLQGCDHLTSNISLNLEERELNYTNIFSDTYLQCLIRSLTISMGDYVGTCRMGADDDTQSVVNSKLKVIGVKGLRVIDASIIPEIPSATINAATIMIGERGAQFIKQDYQSSEKSE